MNLVARQLRSRQSQSNTPGAKFVARKPYDKNFARENKPNWGSGSISGFADYWVPTDSWYP
jgi:hypothetical protein